MNKLIKGAFVAAAAVIGLTAYAQMNIPVDSNVRIGKLDNGLTYYIRHNETPKGQVDFHIAQKVGSILENDNQRGLAHFLEHMCFNGTENFPGSSLRDWLESIGVKFGVDLNAYTSIDETVYRITNVPAGREGVQDSCLLILHDWADGLLLEPEEIDKERGVIHEEWRRSNVGQMRVVEQLLPIVYPGSKYGYRLPIGIMEVVDNFPHQALRDYYEEWYRPDQQGIIVVGDIDVDRIENKIKEIFSPIKMPADAPERVYEEVADNEGTIYAIGKDKEVSQVTAQLMFKTDVYPDSLKNDISYMAVDYIVNMLADMLNNRFDDLTSDPNTTYNGAGVYYDNFFLAKTKDALTLGINPKGNDLRPALADAYRELLRAQRGGFTDTEYDRVRSEYLSRLEKTYNDRNNRNNNSYAQEYIKNFTDNEPIPALEDEYQLMTMIANQVPVEAINQVMQQLVTPDNRIFMAVLPDNGSTYEPTAEEVAKVLADVEAEDIEVFVDDVKSEPLIPQLPTPGKIISEKPLAQWNATELVLSNGVRVIVKPTTFKEDEIRFNAVALGGTSIVPDSKANELIMLPYALRTSGLGTYTAKDLSKYLAGKQVSANLGLSDYTRTYSGSSTVKDLPTLMELIYMGFTDRTIDETEYTALVGQLESSLAFQEVKPEFIFNRDLFATLFNNPRKAMITSEIAASADREAILEIAKNATANAAEYTFVFVGNIDMNTFRPLAEQYLATLPADVAKSVGTFSLNPDLSIAKGKGTHNFTTAMETPQTYVAVIATGNVPYTSKNAKIASIAGQIMSNRLLQTVREDMGAVYSIGASGSLSRLDNNASIETVFPMKPEMKAEVLDFIASEFKAMEDNITEEEVAKAVEY
ncbi:MAG: insulinase family protein, partial [Muribaculaceae bacterium]|nr:insulinase family protein [Muribaculaceae bacterium]